MVQRFGLVAAAAAAIVVTGCSGSSAGPTTSTSPTASALTPVAYRAELAKLSHQEDKAHRDAESAFRARSVAQMRSVMLRFAADQRDVATELHSVHPPADAVAANAELAKAFDDNAAAIRDAMRQVAGVTSVKVAMTRLQRAKAPQQAGAEIDAAIKKLKKLGYTSGS